VKRFTVLLHPGALEDVREAYRYIVEHSPDGAAKWHAGLVAFVQSLQTFPESHPIAPEDAELKAEVRQALYARAGSTYRLLFVVHEQFVHVVAIRHGARRWLEVDDIRNLLSETDL
jgi:plasmid stabilization system protein ParE